MLAQEVFVLDALRCGGGLGIDGFLQYGHLRDLL